MQAILSELSHLLVSFYPFHPFSDVLHFFLWDLVKPLMHRVLKKMMQTLSDGFGM